MARREPNGERQLLRQTTLALIMVYMALNTWAVGDYVLHKMHQQGTESALHERLEWQEAALQAIAKKLEIPIPPPPSHR